MCWALTGDWEVSFPFPQAHCFNSHGEATPKVIAASAQDLLGTWVGAGQEASTTK